MQDGQAVLGTDQLPSADKLEELDLLKLLIVNRDIDLYDAQMTVLKLKMAEANRALAAINQVLRNKYNLTERDSIEAQTGTIVRGGADAAK